MEVSPDMLSNNPYCMKKFAELIIQECIKVIGPDWDKFNTTPMSTIETYAHGVIEATRTECIAEIQAHFGLKD